MIEKIDVLHEAFTSSSFTAKRRQAGAMTCSGQFCRGLSGRLCPPLPALTQMTWIAVCGQLLSFRASASCSEVLALCSCPCLGLTLTLFDRDPHDFPFFSLETSCSRHCVLRNLAQTDAPTKPHPVLSDMFTHVSQLSANHVRPGRQGMQQIMSLQSMWRIQAVYETSGGR